MLLGKLFSASTKASTSPHLVDLVERVGLLEAELKTSRRKMADLDARIEEERDFARRGLESIRARLKARVAGKFGTEVGEGSVESTDGGTQMPAGQELSHEAIWNMARQKGLQ